MNEPYQDAFEMAEKHIQEYRDMLAAVKDEDTRLRLEIAIESMEFILYLFTNSRDLQRLTDRLVRRFERP